MILKRQFIKWGLVLVPIILSEPVLAQDTNKKDESNIDDYYIDFAVPDLPALGSLGFGTNAVTTPRTVKELTASLLTLSDGNNGTTPAIGIAWSPGQTIRARSVDAQRRNWLRRILLSFGTATSDNDSRVGLGIRYVALDHADPLRTYGTTADQDRFATELEKIYDVVRRRNREALAFTSRVSPLISPLAEKICEVGGKSKCRPLSIEATLTVPWEVRNPPAVPTAIGQMTRFERTLRAVAQEWAPNTSEGGTPTGLRLVSPDLQSHLEVLSKSYIAVALRQPRVPSDAIAALQKQWEEKHWNAAVMSIDAGYIMKSRDSSWGRLRGEKVGGVLAAAFPMGSRGQVIIQLLGSIAVSDSLSEESRVSLGSRLLFGNNATRLSFEALVARTRDQDPMMTGRTIRFTSGVEFRLTDGLWFEVAAGGEQLPANADNGMGILTLGNLKYAFRRKRRDLTP